MEFCTLTRDFTDEDRREARRLLEIDALDPGEAKEPKARKVYKAADYRA